MGDAAEPARIDYHAYLSLERATEQKHEWLEGRVYAMAGGTLEHGQLAMQAGSELVRLASACGCRVFGADAKVRVRATGLATYADASVVCGPLERDPEDHNAMTNPAVLVEVRSDSTEAYDRGEKFEHYRQIPSLRDYVLISQRRKRVEVYSRDELDRWVLTAVGAGERSRSPPCPGRSRWTPCTRTSTSSRRRGRCRADAPTYFRASTARAWASRPSIRAKRVMASACFARASRVY